VPLQETLGALAQVKKLGMCRHIGVSNFTVALIEEAVAACPEQNIIPIWIRPR
jgi:2,5-diketo-D-gluconate reductase B